MRRQRRQNTRLNLGRDPLGAGVAYSQSGFNDLGGLLSQKIQEGTAKVASFEKQRRDELKLEEEKAGLMVEGFMAMPKKPIIPAVRISGMTLGSSEMRIMRNERNIYAINSAINKIASPKETTKLRTKKRVPLR